MNMDVAVKAYVERHYDELLDLWRELCRIPAPSLHEEKRAAFCKTWLETAGAEGVYIDEALNVVWPLGCDGKDAITAIVAHTDTVFSDTAPMTLTEDEERLYCPGCGDDTASLAVLLMTARFLIEQRFTPKNGLLFVCNSGEEGLGNLRGTRQVFADYRDRIACFIALDSDITCIADRCVGSCRYKVTARTVGGHSYLDAGNENAIHALAHVVTALYALPIPQDGMGKTTVNVGTITGGTSVNTIAQSATMLCEYRSDNVAHLEMMQRGFARVFAVANTADVTVEVEVVGERPCAKDVDETALDRLRTVTADIVAAACGERPTFRASSTDCNIPLSLGVPAVCVGVYHGDGQHTREEWVDKESMRAGLEISLRIALRSEDLL